MLIYEGPSALDNEPIIVVAVPDYSKKVGHMLLTWIILRDVDPRVAAYDGRDRSICGDCKYRAQTTFPVDERMVSTLSAPQMLTEESQRACYVRPHLEPWVVWTKFHDDEYPKYSALFYPDDMPTDDPWFQNWQRSVNPHRMPVRVGSYGDPAVVPTTVWKHLASTADRYTGYTHLWDDPKTDPDLKQYCMASVDTVAERARAQTKGWRTFYVSNHEHVDDILCPASKEAGKKTTCDKCRLCMGTGVDCDKSIWIPAHGPGKDFVTEVPVL